MTKVKGRKILVPPLGRHAKTGSLSPCCGHSSCLMANLPKYPFCPSHKMPLVDLGKVQPELSCLSGSLRQLCMLLVLRRSCLPQDLHFRIDIPNPVVVVAVEADVVVVGPDNGHATKVGGGGIPLLGPALRGTHHPAFYCFFLGCLNHFRNAAKDFLLLLSLALALAYCGCHFTRLIQRGTTNRFAKIFCRRADSQSPFFLTAPTGVRFV